jgi:CubicO group peptidase (beta-lactamase class C family)
VHILQPLNKLKFFLILTGLILAATTGHAQVITKTLQIEKAHSLADSIFKAQNLPGLSVAVAVNNELVLSEGFGFADMEKQIPVGSETQFRIGSVSKLFTSTAAVRLHQQNRFNLHAPIHKYLPGLQEPMAQITAYQLAGHLSGIRHYSRDEYINRTAFNDLVETLSIFMNDSLLSIPGEEYSYSSYGYNLLGAVMQAAIQQEFRELVKAQLLEPLEMNSTIAEYPESKNVHQVQFYSRNQQGGFQVAIFTDLSDRWPSGGYWSTAEDLVRFGMGVLNKNILNSESKMFLFTNQQKSNGEEIGVGMGWRIGTDNQGRQIVYHGGDSIGGRAFLLVYPYEKIIIAMVSNLSFAGFGEKETMEIANIFLEITD